MKVNYFPLILLLVVLFSCSNHANNANRFDFSGRNTTKRKPINKLNSNNISRSIIVIDGDTLVPVNQFNSKIFIDLKYASSSNFMHRKLYDTLTTAYVQLSVARRLSACQQYLTKIDSNLHLLVYDGLRPLSVQWEMWKALDTIPVSERVKFVSNPANGSVHNYGAAVDLTICDNSKNPLDMGANYDDSRKIAYPSLESVFLASGELSEKQLMHRKLLRSVMISQQFSTIPTEWWHFNAYSRNVSKQKFSIVTHELSAN